MGVVSEPRNVIYKLYAINKFFKFKAPENKI